MGLLSSTVLKLIQTFFYAVTFCCAAVILAVYSYFLAVLAGNNLSIANWKNAVEGISGAAVVYLAFAVILTCFIGGIRIFAFLAIILNILFAAGFIAIAVLTRDGVHSCSGNVNTPLGNGPASSGNGFTVSRGSRYGFSQQPSANYNPNLGLACKLNKAAFAVSILGAVLFLVMAGLQLLLARKHKEDKQFQSASGSGKRRFWDRKPRSTTPGAVESGYTTTKPEPATYDPHYVGGHNSGTTGGYTGTTVVPGSQPATTYDSTGRPIANPYQTAPTGPYTNY
jgi:hypothetical protein